MELFDVDLTFRGRVICFLAAIMPQSIRDKLFSLSQKEGYLSKKEADYIKFLFSYGKSCLK